MGVVLLKSSDGSVFTVTAEGFKKRLKIWKKTIKKLDKKWKTFITN